jgi:hypothetical protein
MDGFGPFVLPRMTTARIVCRSYAPGGPNYFMSLEMGFPQTLRTFDTNTKENRVEKLR